MIPHKDITYLEIHISAAFEASGAHLFLTMGKGEASAASSDDQDRIALFHCASSATVGVRINVSKSSYNQRAGFVSIG